MAEEFAYTQEEKERLFRVLDAGARVHFLVPTSGNICRRRNCTKEGNGDDPKTVRNAIERGGPIIWIPKFSGYAVMDADPNPNNPKNALTPENIDKFLEQVREKIKPAAIIRSNTEPNQHILIRIDESVSADLKNPVHYWQGSKAGEIKHSVQCTIWHPNDDFANALINAENTPFTGHNLIEWLHGRRPRRGRKKGSEIPHAQPPLPEPPEYLKNRISRVAEGLSIIPEGSGSDHAYFQHYDLDKPIERGRGTSHDESIGRLRQAVETKDAELLQKTCAVIRRDRSKENVRTILDWFLETELVTDGGKAFIRSWLYGDDEPEPAAQEKPPESPVDGQKGGEPPAEPDKRPDGPDNAAGEAEKAAEMADIPFSQPERTSYPGLTLPLAAPAPPIEEKGSYKPTGYSGKILENGQYVVRAPNVGSDAFLEAMDYLGFQVAFEQTLHALVFRPNGSDDFKDWKVMTPQAMQKFFERIEQDCARMINSPKGKPEPRALAFDPKKMTHIVDAISVTHSFSMMVAWLNSLANNFTPTDRDYDLLETWLNEWGVGDNPLTRYLTKSIILGVVQRSYNPGSVIRMFPVLVGPRKMGKSALVRSLLPDDLPAMFRSESFSYSKETKESAIALRGVVIAETSEMVGASKSDNAAMKSFLTSAVITYRPLYSNQTIQMPARFMLVGTANDDVKFLSDDTTTAARSPVIEFNEPGRDPVKVLDEKDANGMTLRDRLFATAVHVWRSFAVDGVTAPLAYPPKEIEPLATESVRDYQYVNSEVQDCVAEFMEKHMYEARTGVTATQMVRMVFDNKTFGFATPTRVGHYLASQEFWFQRRTAGKRLWLYDGPPLEEFSETGDGAQVLNMDAHRKGAPSETKRDYEDDEFK